MVRGGGKPTREQQDRLAVARLSGIAARYARRGVQPGEDPVAELRAVSDDPRLLAMAAALSVPSADTNRHSAEALRLLRAAGADEQVLAEQAEVVRRRLAVPDWHDS